MTCYFRLFNLFINLKMINQTTNELHQFLKIKKHYWIH